MNSGSPLFGIFLSKPYGVEQTQEAILRHVEHLRKLDNEGKLVLGGPFLDHPSGLVVVRAKDKSEAKAIAESDPFVKEGLRTFEIRTWLIADAANNYLA